jgi:tetratricopeptide (TPR) repeat protein
MELSTTSDEIEIIKNADFMKSETLALANALYHEGRLGQAVDLLCAHADRSEGDERLAASYLLAKTYNGVGNHVEALQLLRACSALAHYSKDHQLLARYRETLGGTYQLIAERENFETNADRALIEYAAASFHYEQSGCLDVAGCTQNNIGLILCELGKFNEAREHFQDARRFLVGYPIKAAEVDMSEVELCFKEGRRELDAYRLATRAVGVFTEHEATRLIKKYTPMLQKALGDYIAAA